MFAVFLGLLDPVLSVCFQVSSFFRVQCALRVRNPSSHLKNAVRARTHSEYAPTPSTCPEYFTICAEKKQQKTREHPGTKCDLAGKNPGNPGTLRFFVSFALFLTIYDWGPLAPGPPPNGMVPDFGGVAALASVEVFLGFLSFS